MMCRSAVAGAGQICLDKSGIVDRCNMAVNLYIVSVLRYWRRTEVAGRRAGLKVIAELWLEGSPSPVAYEQVSTVILAQYASSKWKPAGKPGSVVGNHSSGIAVTSILKRPTRRHRGPRYGLPIWSCSRWGFPSHKLLPVARCALTAPFHPYLPSPMMVGRAVSFLLHFP